MAQSLGSQAAGRGCGHDLFNHAGTIDCRSDESAFAETSPPDLELWLDQEHEVAGRLDECAQDGQHEPQGDEAEVRDQQLGRASEVARAGIADVETGAFDDSGVTGQLFSQLAMTDIQGDDLTCAMTQQDLAESTGGSPDVETSLTGNAEPARSERLQGRDQLVCRATHPALHSGRQLESLARMHRRRDLLGR